MNNKLHLIFITILLSFTLLSCDNGIDDMPSYDSVIGKWEYSYMVEASADCQYTETDSIISTDLRNRWESVESGSFTYEFTKDNKFFYNDVYRGNYTFTGSGLIISNLESGTYKDKGSFHFTLEGDRLIVSQNFASEYRDTANVYANLDLLQSLGLKSNIVPQHIYGAWVKLAFKKVN